MWRKIVLAAIFVGRAITGLSQSVEEMEKIAGFIADTVYDFDNKKASIAEGVAELCAKFPIYVG